MANKKYITATQVNEHLYDIMKRGEFMTDRDGRVDMIVAVAKAMVSLMAIDMQAETGAINPEGLSKASTQLVQSVAEEFNEAFSGEPIPEEDIALAMEQAEKRKK